ncbi:MAG: hypothetical protein RL368_1774 [Pseudomonadota bacterium]
MDYFLKNEICMTLIYLYFFVMQKACWRDQLFGHKMAAKSRLQSYENYAIIFDVGVATYLANAGD